MEHALHRLVEILLEFLFGKKLVNDLGWFTTLPDHRPANSDRCSGLSRAGLPRFSKDAQACQRETAPMSAEDAVAQAFVCGGLLALCVAGVLESSFMAWAGAVLLALVGTVALVYRVYEYASARKISGKTIEVNGEQEPPVDQLGLGH